MQLLIIGIVAFVVGFLGMFAISYFMLNLYSGWRR